MEITIAWTGEGRCSPRRLGWWDTDLVDEAGGGDFFSRLLPQTHAWAGLEAVREVGIEESRTYGEHVNPAVPVADRSLLAFEQRWFGSKSLERIRFLGH